MLRGWLCVGGVGVGKFCFYMGLIILFWVFLKGLCFEKVGFGDGFISVKFLGLIVL